jgi:8-hydroxy-5-deazaflavin:NADPH oxidoreductase
VPFSGLADTIRTIKPSLRQGQIVVNVTVPLETAISGKATKTLTVWAGSAGEFASALLPRGVKVVSAFNNVSAEILSDLTKRVDCDILICGDDEDAKQVVFGLVGALPGARPIDAGRLDNSRTVEQLTALLVSLNIRYATKSAGIRITGIAPA